MAILVSKGRVTGFLDMNIVASSLLREEVFVALEAEEEKEEESVDDNSSLSKSSERIDSLLARLSARVTIPARSNALAWRFFCKRVKCSTISWVSAICQQVSTSLLLMFLWRCSRRLYISVADTIDDEVVVGCRFVPPPASDSSTRGGRGRS